MSELSDVIEDFIQEHCDGAHGELMEYDKRFECLEAFRGYLEEDGFYDNYWIKYYINEMEEVIQDTCRMVDYVKHD